MHTHIAICRTSLFIFIYNSGIRQYQQFPIKTMPSGLLALFFTCTPHPRHLLHLKLVRKADTKHCVDFWSALPASHGGVHSRFNHLYGSMAFGFVHLAAADSKWREVPEQVGRASHKRAVVAPVVVSAMYRTKLLGDAAMELINRLYALTCVASSFSWYVAPPITHCTRCAWQGHSDCETTCHTWCCCTGRGRNKYRDMYTQRGVIMGALVNKHFCGVTVYEDVSRGAQRHRTPFILTLFASTHNMNMCVS